MGAVSAHDRAMEIEGSVLDRARRGDQEAFAALIRHYDPGVRALAYRLLGDRDRMDDALQEAYVRAFRALPRFRAASTLGTWLYRIAYNVCLEELERSRRLRLVPLEDAGERPDPRADVAETVASRTDLAAALATLSPQDRAAVLLVDAQGFDYRSAGEVLGVPEGTIASRLNRARALLRRVWQPRTEEVTEG
jgi:RNA polymerase sigma-70 factor (ECF subfamily)